MKLSNEVVAFIQRVVKTAKLVDIDRIVIESDCVRAIDEDKTVVIYQSGGVPELPFDSIGISRIDEFLSRLGIVNSHPSFHMETIIDDTDKYVLSLKMKATGTTIDYRCVNPSSVQAPKQIMDEMKASISFNDDDVGLMQKGHSAMSAELITFINDGSEVSLEMADTGNDIFKHVFTDSAVPLLPEVDARFAYRYPVKTLLSLFKQNTDRKFEIGQKGILSIMVNNLNVFVLPRI